MVATALLAATSCTPLPPAAIDVRTGPTSDQFTVRFDPALGTPASLVNRSLQDAPGSAGTKPVSDADAEAAVRALLADRKEWFRLRPGIDDVRLVRSEARGWLRSLRFEQTYRGVAVAGAGYDAGVLANGRVGSLEGQLHPDLNIDLTPVLSATEAEHRARDAFPPGVQPRSLPGFQFERQNHFREATVLVILPQRPRYALAWATVVAITPTDHARIYVDAANGALLGMQRVGWSGSR